MIHTVNTEQQLSVSPNRKKSDAFPDENLQTKSPKRRENASTQPALPRFSPTHRSAVHS